MIRAVGPTSIPQRPDHGGTLYISGFASLIPGVRAGGMELGSTVPLRHFATLPLRHFATSATSPLPPLRHFRYRNTDVIPPEIA
ncbi:MAG: hypothetical protein WC718_16400 [Phycisphaerales bacterium]|jgi:hypothetical protein